jgi:general secretion pathway protein G
MRRQKGFTLIELLIVVAIIGIIAAIAIPNLLNAINRGRQKRTMADMRTIMTAVGAYAVDNMYFPMGQSGLNALGGYLAPLYIKTFPRTDGWRTEYFFRSDSAGADYTLISYAKDHTFNGTIPSGDTPTTTFDADIIGQGGVFVQYPDGTQQ